MYVPAGLTSIGKGAFAHCSSMTSIELPAGLMSLGGYAFQGCSSMTSIKLPACLTSIGERAFRDCSSLTSIELPAGLTSLGGYAFYGCSSLTSIELPDCFDESILRFAQVPPSAILRFVPADDGRGRRLSCPPASRASLPLALTAVASEFREWYGERRGRDCGSRR